MVVTNIWLMCGFTIWSLRNIFTLVILFSNACFYENKDDTVYRYWLFNFVLFTLFGYVVAVLTVLVIPGIALYQCYKQTDRQVDQNPYNYLGQSQKESTIGGYRTVSNAFFDQHQMASKRKLQKISEQQTTLEVFRNKVVDIFVRKTMPKTRIASNYEEILV